MYDKSPMERNFNVALGLKQRWLLYDLALDCRREFGVGMLTFIIDQLIHHISTCDNAPQPNEVAIMFHQNELQLSVSVYQIQKWKGENDGQHTNS